MNPSYVPVAVVTSRTEAELIAGMLRSNGLRADVSADDAGGQDPQLQILGVRVLVAAADERGRAEAEPTDTPQSSKPREAGQSQAQHVAQPQRPEQLKIYEGPERASCDSGGLHCCLGANAKARP